MKKCIGIRLAILAKATILAQRHNTLHSEPLCGAIVTLPACIDEPGQGSQALCSANKCAEVLQPIPKTSLMQVL
jgi:hypothetical protein